MTETAVTESAASPDARRFLIAEWRHLILLNYAIDPRSLRDHLPAGTELDTFGGTTFVSVVGFRFLHTRVFGFPIPWHRNFEEVNLRFYVRHKSGSEWRRGVVFVKEFVPRAAIAWAARRLYGERYVAAPMSHQIEVDGRGFPTRVAYSWRYRNQEHRMSVRTSGEPAEMQPGSQEEFIAEHYWAYVRRENGTLEYRVDHPRWRIWNALESELDCDVCALYGPEFAEALSGVPASAFLAEGSEVLVYRGRAITR